MRHKKSRGKINLSLSEGFGSMLHPDKINQPELDVCWLCKCYLIIFIKTHMLVDKSLNIILSVCYNFK